MHPAPKEFDRVLDQMPALADTFGVALWDKVTGAEDASVKEAQSGRTPTWSMPPTA